MKAKKSQKKNVARWTDYVRRSSAIGAGAACFYIRGSRSDCFSFDGYLGGHPIIDRLLEVCEAAKYPKKHEGWSSPGNPSSYETHFKFLDGGMSVFSGNYLCGDQAQGAYLYGFRAMRWALRQLECPQPRKLKGEIKLRLVPPPKHSKQGGGSK